MNNIHSSLHLNILIHAYAYPIEFPFRGGCVEEYERGLEAAGLIEKRNHSYYECTPRGKAHIEQILKLPFPTQAWVGANGEIIPSSGGEA